MIRKYDSNINHMKKTMSFLLVFLTALFSIMPPALSQDSNGRPNILWITSEDNSPMLGCY